LEQFIILSEAEGSFLKSLLVRERVGKIIRAEKPVAPLQIGEDPEIRDDLAAGTAVA
jgi:hypothetical protein